MPIGKDSIEKRVAKPDAETVSTAKKTNTEHQTDSVKSDSNVSAVKKQTAKSAAKSSTTKNTAGEKTPAKTKTTAQTKSNVLTNVAPETVEKVIGHKEDNKYEKIGIGDDMPYYLM